MGAGAEYRVWSRDYQRKRRRLLGAIYDLKRSRARLQTLVLTWKKMGCADCGYDDIRAIEPDHNDDAVKVGNLSRMVQMCASEERIRTELDKCVPRCVRCHRRVTQQRRPCAWRSAERLPPSWQRRLDQQDQNDKLKMILGCLDCRWREWPRGLDWDHVAGEKVTDIANDCERASVVGDLSGNRQVRLCLRELSSNTDGRAHARVLGDDG